MSRFDSVSIVVDGTTVTSSGEQLTIDDVSEDMIRVAAQVGYWGSVLGAAKEERTRADAAYRQWRARYGASLVEGNPKLAEHKIRQLVESDDMFVKLKAAIAKADGNVVAAETRFEAFKIKAMTLQSYGAMDRAGLNAHVVTKKKTKSASEEERKEAMRRANRKKKSKSFATEPDDQLPF